MKNDENWNGKLEEHIKEFTQNTEYKNKQEIMTEKIRYRENKHRRYNIWYERLDWPEEVVIKEIMEGKQNPELKTELRLQSPNKGQSEYKETHT